MWHLVWMTTLLTLKETAARLRTTTKHAKGLITDGKLKWINVGRGHMKSRIRVSSDDIDEFEQNNKREGSQSPCLSIRTKKRRSTLTTFGSRIVDIKTL